MSDLPPLIALEEHFLPEDASSKSLDGGGTFPESTTTALKDVSMARMAAMDAASIRMQVLSRATGSLPFDACRQSNNSLHSAVTTHPDRLAGFAALPMDDPPAATHELRRCVQELGFYGALIENHLPTGEYYDDERFWCVFSEAQRLDVPIYIHPSFPPTNAGALFEGNYADVVQVALGAFAWGWHSSVSLHILRLFAAGLFEEYPRLKVVIGHSGEGLPFFLERIEAFSRKWPVGKKRQSVRTRHLRQVWDENIFVTTSGMFALSPMACLLQSTRIDHILFSVDYPFARNEDGRDFMWELSNSGLVNREELEMIAYKNAVNLLRLDTK